MPIAEALPSARQPASFDSILPRSRGMGYEARRFARHRGALAGVVIFGAFVLVALCAPLVARHDPLAVDPEARLSAPSPSHPFGTDQLGRDQFSRVIYGSRVSLVVGVVPVLIAAAA